MTAGGTPLAPGAARSADPAARQPFLPVEITPEILRELISYNSKTGELFWLERRVEFFRDQYMCKAWNTKYAGTRAFKANRGVGHRYGCLFNQKFYAHRVAWAIYYGAWPTKTIDHINGNPADNRISNLRDVPHRVNMCNQKLNRTNKSGCSGVRWNRRDRRWQASIKTNGKTIHIGNFKNLDDAATARKFAETKYGFHENHGRLVSPVGLVGFAGVGAGVALPDTGSDLSGVKA